VQSSFWLKKEYPGLLHVLPCIDLDIDGSVTCSRIAAGAGMTPFPGPILWLQTTKTPNPRN
jgi:hypothetical protein